MAEREIAVVTGGTRGIGLAISRRLARDGMRVAVAARTGHEVDAVAGELGGIPLALDVTDSELVSSAVGSVEEQEGPIALLVNNAGIAESARPFWEQDLDAWWRVFQVNVIGPANMMRAVVPSMVDRGQGRVVNMSSELAHIPVRDGPTYSAYMASKAALTRLTEAIAFDALPAGVRLFSVRPGAVKTEMTERMIETLGEYSPDIPEKFNKPEEAAALVSFIAGGALDKLSGRHIDLAREDWPSLPSEAERVQSEDRLALRLRTSTGFA